MRRAWRVAATGLALCAMSLTVPAWADSDPQGAPAQGATPPAAPTGTPLALRPGKPIELAQEPQHAGVGWKIVAALVVAGGAILYARKRGRPGKAGSAELTIVRRAAVGMRSELLVVNVEGQRLLIGVTPHSIQSLAILDAEEPKALPTQAPESALGERFAAMLESADRRTARRAQPEKPQPEKAAATAPASDEDEAPRERSTALAIAPAHRESADDDVAGQAMGLLALRRGG